MKRNIPTVTEKKQNKWISAGTLIIVNERREAKANGDR